MKRIVYRERLLRLGLAWRALRGQLAWVTVETVEPYWGNSLAPDAGPEGLQPVTRQFVGVEL